MKIFGGKMLLTLLGAFLVLGVCYPAFAQDADEDDVFMLEEVTVTAAKQGEQNLQKVPISMDVITGEDFAAQAKDDVDDILSNLAGVFINTGSDGMRVSIRGMTDTDPVHGGRKSSSPTVALNVDGAYNSMSNASQNLFDVERVEVLMGPQSTLYASNSPGGVVNIITASPKTDKFSASFSGLYGNYGHSELKATVNAPIVQDLLAMRLAASRTRQNSYLEPYTDDLASKNDAARLKVLWDASEDLEITLTGNYSVNGNRGEMTQQVDLFDKASGSSDWTASESATGAMGSLDQETTGGNLNISWDSPIGNLSVEPSYSKSDGSGDESGVPMGAEEETTWYSERVMEQTGAEARLASPGDSKLQYVAGLFYYENTFRSSSTYYDAAYSNNDSYNNNDAEQTAVYGNVTYPLPFNEKLSVTGGYRYSWDWAKQTSLDGRGNDVTEMDVANPDYKVGFEYDLSDQAMFYGSYTSSFRTDGMAMTNNVGRRPAEDLKAYTVGAKTRMLNNRLQLNASAYYYDYRNTLAQDSAGMATYDAAYLQGLYFDEETTYYYEDDGVAHTGTVAAGTSYYDAAVETGNGRLNEDGSEVTLEDGAHNSWGDQRTIGVDVSLSWVPTSRDLVDLTFSYLNKKWTELYFDYLYEEIWPDKDCDDWTAPNAPEFSMTAGYEHKFDIGDFGILTPHVDLQYKSAFDLTFVPKDDTTGYATQEAYCLYNASVGFVSASQMWSVTAVVKNIANYAVKKNYTNQGPDQYLMIGDPRTYSLTASIKF